MWPQGSLWDNSGGVREWLTQCRESRKLILFIVAIALLLDNMLLTTVVPIIPEYLYKLRHPNATYHHGSGRHAQLHMASTTIAPHSTALGHSEDPSNWEILDRWKQEKQMVVTNQDGSKVQCGCICPTPHNGPTDKDKNHNNTKSSDTRISDPSNHSNRKNASSQTHHIQTWDEKTKDQKHDELVDENVEVGVMLAVKAFVQLIVNPFIGPLTHRVGYSIPMFAGFVILFISTLIFAFGKSYNVLFVARALQGIGSSCSSVSGMGMLADRYPDDKERGNAMGLALGGLALGVLIGPPFGGWMYEYVNKAAPFLILAVLALGDGLLQLLVLQPAVKKQEEEAATLMELVRDPYIIITAGAITFANMGIGILEPSLPLWMMDTMESSSVETGTAFLPASISYLLGTNLFGPCGHRIGRWLSSFIGLIIIGLCLMSIPMATSKYGLIVPNAGLGFAIGMVDSSMMPELANLVDKRHFAVYGSVYSIGDIAFCLGFAVGPALSGYLVRNMGFKWMLYGCAFINFLYAPLMYFLKDPPTKCGENETLIGDKSSVRYVTYKDEEEDDGPPSNNAIKANSQPPTTQSNNTTTNTVPHKPHHYESFMKNIPPQPNSSAPPRPSIPQTYQNGTEDKPLTSNGVPTPTPSLDRVTEQANLDKNPFRRKHVGQP